MAPKSDEIRGNTFESTKLDALEEAINIPLYQLFCPYQTYTVLTSMTFHVALASSGINCVTPYIICVN
jgi:hypothetical protein